MHGVCFCALVMLFSWENGGPAPSSLVSRIHTYIHPHNTHPPAGALLTQFLGDAIDDTAAGVSVSLHAKELLQVFVPGNGAGVFPGSTTTTTGGGGGNRGLSLVVDRDVPSALLYSTRAGQEEEEALVTDASPKATYTLVLDNFPANQLLSLRLTPPSGAARLLGRVPFSASASASRGASQSSDDSNDNDSVRWMWRVAEGTPPGQYFIEVASQRQDAFAYSQAFRVV